MTGQSEPPKKQSGCRRSLEEAESLFLENMKLVPYIANWLNYGKCNGLGQWRNSGKGRFTWELIEQKEVDG